MKKKFHLLLFLIVGFLLFFYDNWNVNSSVKDVSIKEVVLEEKGDSVDITGEPTYQDMNINFAIKFYGVNDYAKYKITIENKGNDDVLIRDQGIISEVSNDYINYTFSWGDNDNSIIKANSSKDFYINITYAKKVDNKDFNEDNKFIEDRAITINLEDKPEEVDNNTNNDKDENQVNLTPTSPKTGDTIMKNIILLGVSLIGIIIIGFILIKKKYININGIFKNINKYNINIALIMIPILLITLILGYTYALETIEIKITSNVEIEKTRLARNCNSDTFTEEYPKDPDSDEYISKNPGFCINWDNYLKDYNITDNGIYKIIMIDTKKMNDTYTTEDGMNYKLYKVHDVSENQNGQIILGVYYDDNDNILLLIGQNGGVNAPIDASDFFESNYAVNVSYMDLNKLDVSESTNMSSMFYSTGDIAKVFTLDLTNWDTSNVTDMSFMFYSTGASAEVFTLDLTNWDTSKVTNMSSMFNCAGRDARKWSIDGLFNWNTSKVTNMSSMFEWIGSFAESVTLDLSNWDTSNVTNMRNMFTEFGENATNSVLKINNFNFEQVTDNGNIFVGMINNTSIYVKSEKEQNWILDLSSNDRPSTWTTENILIAE